MSSVFAILVIFISLISLVSANADPLPDPIGRASSYADLGARRLMERAAAPQEQEATASETTTSHETIPESTGLATAGGTSSTDLPQPFDTTLGNNFTSEACPNFFLSFLSDQTFQSCYPFSLLLQTSHGFFQAQKNFYQTTTSLQAGCDANFDQCNSLMQTLATQLKAQGNCASDYAAENQIVMQAYTGLLAYPVMYQAACLKEQTGDYCFADAVTLRENASLADAYSYYLPLGTSMPVGTRPSCSDCLKRTMNIYRTYAANSTQPISRTYASAAQQVNMACGIEWVSDVIASSNDGGMLRPASLVGSLAVGAVLLTQLL